MVSVRGILEEKFNNRVVVSQSTFSRVKTLYVGLYKQAMLQLYVNGFISDPGRWNEDEILTSLYEQGYLTFQSSGRMVLDETLLLYEVYKEDFKEGIEEAFNPEFSPSYDPKNWESYISNFSKPAVSRMFYIALRLRNIIEVFDRYYETIGARGRGRITVQNRVSYLSGKIWSSKTPLNEAIAQLLAGYEAKMVYCSYGKPFRDSLYAFFGVEDDGTATFIEGVSAEQEAELLLEMSDGDHILTGECGEMLSSWVKLNVWDVKGGTGGSLKDTILLEEEDVYKTSLVDILEGFEEGLTGVMTGSNGAYLSVDRVKQSVHVCGQYVYDTLSEELVTGTAVFSGMTGEFIENISQEDAIDFLGIDLEFKGSPLIVHSGSSFVEAYDLDFVGNSEHLNGGNTWFSSIEATLDFEDRSIEEIQSMVDTSTIENALKSSHMLSENGYFGPLIGGEPLSTSEFSKVLISVAKELS